MPGLGCLDGEWHRSLIEAGDDDQFFTLEDGTWRRIIAFRTPTGELVHEDYATGAGYSVRFGDDVFGLAPNRGDLFTLTYRLGSGARANVPAGSVSSFTAPGKARTLPLAVTAVSNPLAVTNGVDPESSEDIKLLTPEAYQASVLFAVRPDDYGEQAERLDFVQRAQGAFRWTGTWHSAVVSVDPFGAFTLTDEERTDLQGLLDCVRQAGREVLVKDPKFVDLDLEITICVEPFAFAGQVEAQVLEVLFGRGGPRPVKGFFDPDNFTFGTPLRRAALEATIHDVSGVRSVLRIRQRRRGQRTPQDFTGLLLTVDPDQVIRIENDPLFPERGRVTLIAEGGA